MGWFDQPKSLGNNEYGSSTALPIWIDFMNPLLKELPPSKSFPPEGLVLVRINKESGLLNILKGSHAEGELDFAINRKFNYSKTRSANCEIPKKTLRRLFMNYKKIKIKVGFGDVLFFDNYLLHSSGKNKSSFIRFVTNTRFFDSNSNEYVAHRPALLYNPYSMKKFSNRKFY